MATTITRLVLTDDSGTPASPVGDGDAWTNAQLQTLQDKIDEMFAGAGAYATFTFGGKIAVEGFGSHTFDASGTGAQILAVRNTAAGTGNRARFQGGNDTAADRLRLDVYSSTFTPSGAAKSDGVSLDSTGGGGLSLVASNALANVRVYARGTTKLAQFNGDRWQLSDGLMGQYSMVGLLRDATDLTNASNTGAAEEDLKTYTVPADALDSDEEALRLRAWGTTAANANSKEIILYWDGVEVLRRGGTNWNDDHWLLDCLIVRTGATSQKLAGLVTSTSNPPNMENWRNTGSATMSGTVVLKLAVDAVAASDITVEGFVVEYLP